MSGLVRVVEMMQRVVGPNQRRKDGARHGVKLKFLEDGCICKNGI